jgi:hypothetical protein
MLRKLFAFLILPLLLGLSHAEDQIATSTSSSSESASPSVTTMATSSATLSSSEPRRPVETEFKKLKQLDPTIQVTKIHEFLNKEHSKSAKSEALKFEEEYWNYGAITDAEKESRKGHYFVISWKNTGAAANFTTRFEYRQSQSRDVIRTLTLQHSNIKGNERSTFAVLGDAYKAYGPVISWRFTILKGDQVVGEEHSFIW